MTDQAPNAPVERVVLQRGKPFAKGTSGNPSGRPPGARNRTTLAVETLLDGEAEKLTRKAIELALGGDLNALRLCFDRIAPPRRERPVEFELSPLSEIDDAKKAMAEIIAAVATGNLTLSEASELAKLVDLFVRACEASEKSEQSSEKAIRESLKHDWYTEDRRDDRDFKKRMGGFSSIRTR